MVSYLWASSSDVVVM